MIRALFPFLLLMLILGIPAISAGMVFTGQVLFAILVVLFLGTLVDAFTDRAAEDR
ncbi:MAG: hypothetical protein M3R08_05605 [Bacteroidota bacterium]|nr:hypothetical protein [Bacteroidota bacterium]